MSTIPAQTSETSATTILPLQEWLKLLASRGVNMRIAMGLAAKIYNSHNTRQRLSELDSKKLTTLVPDKEHRKTVLNAVKGIASGEASVSTSSKPKKRTRDSDLLEPLTNQGDDDKPRSLEFNEVTDPEKLIPMTLTVNRAPVKTAWAYVVSRRLGFDIQESLSIAHVYVHISSLKHALMLGNILNARETKEAEEELSELPGMEKWYDKATGKRLTSEQRKERDTNKKGRNWDRSGVYDKGKEKEDEVGGNSQPWVGILRANPVIERQDGTWRAIEKGIAIPPSQAYTYISRAFKDFSGHVIGAMKLVAESYTPDELNRLGMHFYNEFKPETEVWGEKGILHLSKILDCAKGPVASNLPFEVEEMAKKEAALSRQNSATKPIHSTSEANTVEKSTEDVEGTDGDAEEGEEGDAAELEEGSVLSDLPEEEDEYGNHKAKKAKSNLEAYEAQLKVNGDAGGFTEGTSIFQSPKKGKQ